MLKFSGSSYACQVWLERGCWGRPSPAVRGRRLQLQGHTDAGSTTHSAVLAHVPKWCVSAVAPAGGRHTTTSFKPWGGGGLSPSRPKAHSTATHNQVVGGVSQTLTRACSKWSAMCVQRFDDSLSSAFRITYRISLRSSSS